MPSHVPSSARHAVLAPLDRRGRVAEVERRLADAIRVGVFGDGDQLPSEAELAAQLGVATVTLREALVGLRRPGWSDAPRAQRRHVRPRAGRDRRGAALERLAELSVDELRDLADHHAAIAAPPRASQRSGRRAPISTGSPSTSSGSRAPPPTPSAAPPMRASTSSSRRPPGRSGSRAPRWSCRPRPARSSGSPAARTAAPARWPTTGRSSPPCGPRRRRRPERVVAHVEARWPRSSRSTRPRRARRGAAARRPREPAARAARAGGRGARRRRRDPRRRLRRRGRGALRGPRAARPRPPRADLAPVRDLVHATLARRPLLAGAGMVFAPGVVADAPRWLEWWRSARPGAPVFLNACLDPADPDFYDYERAEWYTTPRDTGGRWIAGPFVDHSGTNEHILTLTLPGHPRRHVPRRGRRRHRGRRDRGDRRRRARGARPGGRGRQPPRADHRDELAAAPGRHALARRRRGRGPGRRRSGHPRSAAVWSDVARATRAARDGRGATGGRLGEPGQEHRPPPIVPRLP